MCRYGCFCTKAAAIHPPLRHVSWPCISRTSSVDAAWRKSAGYSGGIGQQSPTPVPGSKTCVTIGVLMKKSACLNNCWRVARHRVVRAMTEREEGSVLTRLAAKAPGGGAPFLGAHHLAAAERLERLILRSRIVPRVTMSYDAARVGGRDRSGNGVEAA